MRSYGQLCAVARALDVVGDRWTLLIVRELLTRGPARFTDLQTGLPGVAPNLLAQRLRSLTEQGVLQQDRPTSAPKDRRYHLTERGAQLEGVVRELLKWGAPTVPDAPEDAAVQMHWLSLPAQYLLRDNRPDGDAVTVRFGTLRDGFDVTAYGGRIQVTPVRAEVTSTTTVHGHGPVLIGMISGAIPVRRAVQLGVTIEGDDAALERVLPTHERVAAP